jgi:predicted transcriptional regulator
LTEEPTNWSILLRDLRVESGITQKALARKADLPQRTIAECESVRLSRQLSIYKVETILDALGYEIDVFLRSA